MRLSNHTGSEAILQCVSIPTTTILPITAGTYIGLTCSSHMIYISQTTRTKILQNFRFNLLYIYTRSVWVLLYILGRKKGCNNSHTSSTRIDLYDIPHIFYTRIIHIQSSDTDWILLIYIYIYIYIPIDIMVRMFTNSPADQGSISGRVKYSKNGTRCPFV